MGLKNIYVDVVIEIEHNEYFINCALNLKVLGERN